jgi:hypothetical protein
MPISRKLVTQLAVIALLLLSASALLSEDIAPSTEARLSKLEQRVNSLDSVRTDAAGGCGLSLLFGAFCALWAQNSRRSALFWFILGAIFSVITVLVLLYKNSQDVLLGNPPTQITNKCPKCGRHRTVGQVMCDCGHYFGAQP